MILLALAAVSAIPAGKGPIQTYGFPDSDSCATWTAERAKPGYHRQEQEGWVLGLITGLNAFRPGDGNIAPGTNAAGLLGWIDAYCKANPLDSVTTAGFALADELKRRSIR